MPSRKQGSSPPEGRAEGAPGRSRWSAEGAKRREAQGSSDGPAELTTRFRFPHASTADDDGLVAVGGDLKPGTLLLAYSNGIFPWTTHPVTWWSPDPRAVIPVGGVHVSRSLRRDMRKAAFVVTFDRDFRRVMEGCAASRPGREKTWISPQFISAYTRLHALGYAHSVEVWRGDVLAGGLYGVSIGAFFAGESMFSEVENASKVALVAMEERLRSSGFVLFDVQMLTPHLVSMGAIEIPRADYLSSLRSAVAVPVSFAT
jgi:leucyl/phenylalanyl-tRNA---protein transferase